MTAKNLITAWGETRSTSEWARDERCQVSRKGLMKRLAQGQSPEEAMSKEGRRKYEAFGVSKTIKEWSEDERCLVPFHNLYQRILYGWDVERALSEPVNMQPTYQAFGENKTLAEWALDARCVHGDRNILSSRLHMGWDIEMAITTTNSPYNQKHLAFGETKTTKRWSEDSRCEVPQDVLKSRLSYGWSTEQAITRPFGYVGSRPEEDLADFVGSLGLGIETNTRKIIPPYELDIYIPEKRIAIEFNGLYWHNEDHVDKDYHYVKWRLCRDEGIQLIQIWEDDWRDKRPIVEASICNKLSLFSESIAARKTEVIRLVPSEAKGFLDMHHIQGGVSSSVVYGLVHRGSVVACAAFKKEKPRVYTLVRFASSTRVQGGFSKLLKHFVTNHDFSQLKTFADLTISDGSLYKTTGWIEDGFIQPDYKYVANNTRVHKFNYRRKRFETDPTLRYDPGMSESELAKLNSLKRIYDAGKIRFIYDGIRK